MHRPTESEGEVYDDLQAVISSVPSSDVLLVMEDFNARVGYVDNSTSEIRYREILILAKSMKVASHCVIVALMSQCSDQHSVRLNTCYCVPL